ncbi:MAG TPA: UvrD-helicase domain-containing protein [Vicinamibacteria bacterium]|nr:UvrD-helicase domain-containing protein [Vicinamibacteria bacterium]
MGDSFRPVDHEDRERARREHGTSFVLEAGAGTGKTTLLVDRIEALVRSGAVTLDQIAAVTFTENAATTMKLRLRERLERARMDAGAPAVERDRAEQALQVLERAQISTLHALCAAILGERPLECGVVPGFRVADEAEADLLFARAWEEWLAERLVSGDEVLLEALERGIPLEGEGPWGERGSLRGLARTLLEQRDVKPLVAEAAVDAEAWRSELLAQAGEARALLSHVQDGDTLGARLGVLVSFAEESRGLEGSVLVAHLRRLAVIPRNFGHKPRWSTPESLEQARRVAAWTKEASERWTVALGAVLHGRLVTGLLGVTTIYERMKRELGRLDYLDLLLKARDALRGSEPVRASFRRRFRLVLIDEFQDTDPLQVEIADLLTAGVPGALVVVGDAKQSIYRFRRAEVSLFRRASEAAATRPGHAVLHLTQNFRSRPAVLRFINRVFAHLLQASEEAGQPAYEPIAPPPGLCEDPSVIALRFPAPFAEGEDLLRAEAAGLARFIAHTAKGAFEVRDPVTQAVRRSRAGDVMVLVRRLSQVRHLEETLEAAGLRFMVEGGKSFFDRQEVHEALSVLGAIDDPSDRVSLVAALRSSFFGVPDRDIASYALARGSLWLGAAVDETKPGGAALAPALRLLHSLHERRTRDSVASLIERLYDETRVLSALTGTRRGEAQIANLEKVIALARQAAALGVLTLRGFTSLLQGRIEESREEPDLPTTRPGDAHTVRVLSIHKAKGLEAPIVVLYDSADSPRLQADVVPLWEEARIAVGFRGGCQPPGWEALKAREEGRAAAEARRLLYVACTRARDLLVIPVPPKDARAGSFWRDVVMLLPPASDDDVRVIDTDTLPAVEPAAARDDLKVLGRAEGGDAVAQRWDDDRRARIEAAAERPYLPTSVSRVAARTAPPAVTAEGSEGGRDFGSLVHRLLEWIPLGEADADAATERVRSMAEALAPSFGLDAEGAARAAEAATRALALPVMTRARRAPRIWRELGVWFPDGADLVEGKVDLVFEEDGGLIVVDYKTDHLSAEQARAQAAHHAPQLQLYGRGLARATGMPVRERLVLFTALGETVPV